jgi:hypothetical protein
MTRNYCLCGDWFLVKQYLRMHVDAKRRDGETGHGEA